MKGLMSLPANIVGYVIALAIFMTGMGLITMYWMEFQTIPKETQTPERTTACDLAYILSTWEKATVKPTIFNQTFLDSWNTLETSKSIFESESSKFFFPGLDFFLKITTDEKNYTMYVPPESKSVFEGCARNLITPKSLYEAEKFGVEDTLGEFEEAPEEEAYKEKATTYNELHAVCGLPTFVESDNDITIGRMTVGLTSNIATKIRKGIYELSLSDDPNDNERIYRLGEYPSGCLFDKRITKKEKSFQDLSDAKTYFYFSRDISNAIRKSLNFVFDHLENLWEATIGNIIGDNEDEEEIKIPMLEDYCGFVWDWKNQSDRFLLNVNSVEPGKGGCTLKTRIPKRIVNSINLSKRLCEPKDVFLIVNWPEGGWGGKKHFFMKIEELNYNPDNEAQAKKFCKTRCNTEGPTISADGFSTCEDFCEEGWGILGENCVYKTCNFAKNHIYMFKHIPVDAIDIKYIVVDEKDLKKAGSFENLDESDYYAYQSACSSWPGIYDCTTSKDCTGERICIMDKQEAENLSCDVCRDNLRSFCSPKYLEEPLVLNEELAYTCQNVTNYTAPFRGENFSACLPEIQVNYTLLSSTGEQITDDGGNPLKKIDCSNHPNTIINWTVDASEICCMYLGSEEEEWCIGSTGYCPKMKIWSNLDTSHTLYLSEDTFYLNEGGFNHKFRGSIQQRACRDGIPYNNANEYFLVADYHPANEEFRYVMNKSRVDSVTE